jgi:hypothetical protein
MFKTGFLLQFNEFQTLHVLWLLMTRLIADIDVLQNTFHVIVNLMITLKVNNSIHVILTFY